MPDRIAPMSTHEQPHPRPQNPVKPREASGQRGPVPTFHCARERRSSLPHSTPPSTAARTPHAPIKDLRPNLAASQYMLLEFGRGPACCDFGGPVRASGDNAERKNSPNRVPRGLQSVFRGVLSRSRLVRYQIDTQLKSPGRFSSFPFPHLSPLRASRTLPFFQLSGIRSHRSAERPFSCFAAWIRWCRSSSCEGRSGDLR